MSRRSDRRERRRSERSEPDRREDEQKDRTSEPIAYSQAGIPVVPFVPARCPWCGEAKPITDGVHDLKAGRTRYHICKGCNREYHSREVDPLFLGRSEP